MEWRDDLRYDYLMSKDSVVVDLGAFEGAFAFEIVRRHGCRVFAFEPIKDSFDTLVARLLLKPAIANNVRVFNYGWGPANSSPTMYQAGDSSSLTAWLPTYPEAAAVRVTMRDAREVAQELSCVPCDLLKMNIEGAEYDLLEYFLDTRLIDCIKNLQVQFHPYGAGDIGAELRRTHIRERLLATHDCEWEFPFVWESWRKH